MPEAMNEILAEWLTFSIFAVRVDVVVSDVHQPVFFASARKMHSGLHSRKRSVLRAQDDFVDFALSRGELAIRGNRARNIRGVTGILCAHIEHHNVAVLDLARELVVVERGRVRPRADNWSITFSFGAGHGVYFHHFCGHLIFIQARVHHFHRFQMGIQGEVNRLLQESHFAGGLQRTHRRDLRANVLQCGPRRTKLKPVDDGLFVRVATKFLVER